LKLVEVGKFGFTNAKIGLECDTPTIQQPQKIELIILERQSLVLKNRALVLLATGWSGWGYKLALTLQLLLPLYRRLRRWKVSL